MTSLKKMMTHFIAGLLIIGINCFSVVVFGQGKNTSASNQPQASRLNDVTPTNTSGDDPYLQTIYRNFYNTYRISPGDELAIRVVGQPDYTLDKVDVTPMGTIYHPLIGETEVVGLTVPQVKEKLTRQFSEYVVNPVLSVQMLQSTGAKIGVLGEVTNPGVIVMGRPMTVLDAITAAGGFTNFGSESHVTVLRQQGGGKTRAFEVDLKPTMHGKATDEPVMLNAGDTVVVKGNMKKSLAFVTSLVGFGNFVAIIGTRY
ncbi:MAG TPA: polysaccharide biosynthesis/export family protein [Blastocatellia bacterium]|nr:polysaccharide biosynthesis/export family protein [Blastocatellia bacterium]